MHVSKSDWRPSLALVVTFCLGLSAGGAEAQQAAIQGFVSDGGSGQRLEGASVVVASQGSQVRGALSDRSGFYQIGGIDPGSYVLQVRYLGYVAWQEPVVLAPGQVLTVSANLQVDPLVLEGVVVAPAGGAARREMQRQRVTSAELRLVPVPAASGDLASYLQALPGVVTTGDRGGQMFIRGGTHMENMALVDGIMIYQPFHILGFFSVFPEDLVSSVDFYAGGFGARYSGRSSSVLDVQMRDGTLEGFQGSGSVSPFVAEAVIEGPGPEGRYSWIASARRSLLEDTSPTFLGQTLPYGFDSQFVKVTSYGESDSRCSALAMRTSDRGNIGAEDDDSHVSWGNLVLGGRCTTLFEGILRLFEVTVGYTAVDNAAISRGSAELTSRTQRFETTAHSRNLLGRVPFDAGYFFRLEQMKYNLTELFGLRDDADFIWGAGAYLEAAIPLGERATVQPGIVLTGSPTWGVEPRLRASWQPLGRSSEELSGAVGLYRQPQTGIGDSREASSVFVAWTQAPDGPMEALHAQLGWQQSLGSGVQWSLEGYYRELAKVPVPIWNAIAQFNTKLAPAMGDVYGADLRLEYSRSGFYGFAGYGYSWTQYEAGQDHFSTWFGEPVQRYHPPHDRRHQMNAMFSLDLGSFTTGARWQLGTGLPFTRPMGFDEVFDYRFTLQRVTHLPGTTRMILEKPYQGRLPIMHRLDVSVERGFDFSFGRFELQAGAINAYDRTNMFYYDIYTHRRVDQLPFVPYASLRLEAR